MLQQSFQSFCSANSSFKGTPLYEPTPRNAYLLLGISFGGLLLLVAQLLKNPPAMQETWVWSLGWEDTLGKEKATHSSILAWRIPWTEEPGGWELMVLQRVRRDWATNTSTLLQERGLHIIEALAKAVIFPTAHNWTNESLSPKMRQNYLWVNSVQFSSVAQSCLTLCHPMNHSTPSLPVHHQLPEFTQTHVHWVGDAIQPSHPL